MVEVGGYSLLMALLFAGYACTASLVGARSGRLPMIKSAENALHTVAGLLSISMAALLYAFLARDFSVAYVADYSSRSLPLIYTVAAVWGGQEGSLLLWAWTLSLFAAVVILQNRERNRAIMPHVVAILAGVLLFFLLLLTVVSTPFSRGSHPPDDGRGLNPLLQNPGMLWHPPTLFIGYVGFTVPFAFAMAALLTGELGDEWIRSTRRWTIFSWLFLGVGIFWGAKWAYVELGWGGYWAWDPVENASLMPWLTGTAFLHSVMIQERKNMLKVWNVVLILATFLLCIFGTFITRSGILSSVHSFGQSALGPFFLAFLILVLSSGVGLIVVRRPLLRSSNELDSLLSRESSFLVNNLILVGSAFTIFLGTVFPVITEAVRGVKVTVGPPFFNRVNLPIGLALLFVTGVCPLIAWKKATGYNFRRNLFLPVVVALAAAAAFYLAGVRQGYALLAFSVSVFVVATIVLDFLRGLLARSRAKGESFLPALGRLVWGNKRRYGGYVVHLGVVTMVIGIAASSAFKLEKEVRMQKGDTADLGPYTFVYEKLVQYQTQNKAVTAAALAVSRDGKPYAKLSPAVETYSRFAEQRFSEVAISSRFREDLYVILAGHEPGGTAVTLKLIINPLVSWVWSGGTIVALGTVLAMLPDRREKKRLAVKYTLEAVRR